MQIGSSLNGHVLTWLGRCWFLAVSANVLSSIKLFTTWLTSGPSQFLFQSASSRQLLDVI
jgi:hypothetical protein